MTLKEQFEIPKRYNTWSLGLMGIGLLCVIILFIGYGSKSDPHVQSPIRMCKRAFGQVFCKIVFIFCW